MYKIFVYFYFMGIHKLRIEILYISVYKPRIFGNFSKVEERGSAYRNAHFLQQKNIHEKQ